MYLGEIVGANQRRAQGLTAAEIAGANLAVAGANRGAAVAKGGVNQGYQLDLRANMKTYDGAVKAAKQVRDASFEAARLRALSTVDNNCASNDPCAICGERTDPNCGPELFLEGTWALVCYECGWKYAPGLVEALDTLEGGHSCGWRDKGKGMVYVGIGRHVFQICKHCNKYRYWAIRDECRDSSGTSPLAAFAGMKAASLKDERRLLAAIQGPHTVKSEATHTGDCCPPF